MPSLDLGSFQMHYDLRGEGTPLLLLHGGMGIGADWQLVFAEDPAGYQLIVPDLRGHGRSSCPDDGFTFRQCASDVLALLDHLALPHAHAIGLSLGAKTLLHVATGQPSRIQAVVLVSAAPRFPKQLRTAAAQFTREALAQLTAPEREVLSRRHIHGDRQLRWLYDTMRSFAESRDDLAFTPAQLHTIAARTLIVHGDRDRLYPIELAIELFRNIPASALWVVPNGGHGPIFGAQAPSFAAAALAHLSKTAERG
jgi:pimeloyl-ACP methyl ester carboxylesterase